VPQAAILQQAAEYISFLIAERQHLLELNRQYIAAATRCLPSAKRRRGSDGELSEDDAGPGVYTDHHQLTISKPRRSPPCDSSSSRSLPIKKRKDEVTYSLQVSFATECCDCCELMHVPRFHLLCDLLYCF